MSDFDPFSTLDSDVTDFGTNDDYFNDFDPSITNSDIGAFSGGNTGLDGFNDFGNSVGSAFNSLGNSAGGFFGSLSTLGANLASGIFGSGSQTGLLQQLVPNLNQLAAQAGLLGNQAPTAQTPTTTTNNNTLIYLAVGAVILILILRK